MKIALAGGFALGLAVVSHFAAAQDATTSTTVSSTASVQPGQAVPAGASPAPGSELRLTPTVAAADVPADEKPSPINRPLLVTGFLLFGGSYLASVIDAQASGRPEDRSNLNYPVVGPWMDYANRNCGATPCAGGGLETFNKALLIADGVGQGLGALMIVTSFFIPERATHHWMLIGNGKVMTGPTMVGSGYGVGAIARF